jgi:hypothetical protein
VDLDGALKAIDEAANALTLDVKRRLRQGYEVDAARVRLGGKIYVRVGRYTAYSLAQRADGSRAQSRALARAGTEAREDPREPTAAATATRRVR